MTSAPLISFCNVDLAFGDHLVLGKLSFEIGTARLSMSLVPSGAAKPRRGASPPGSSRRPVAGFCASWAGWPPLLP
ncbi:MAG TPA: hypothetical protein VGL12_06175 [Roseiarcus sp.]|jgi:hypothetical protein